MRVGEEGGAAVAKAKARLVGAAKRAVQRDGEVLEEVPKGGRHCTGNTDDVITRYARELMTSSSW